MAGSADQRLADLRGVANRVVGAVPLRPTWRGVGVAALCLVVLVAALVTGHAGFFALLAVLALPLLAAPVLVVGRVRRAEGLQVRLMVVPPVLPDGAQGDLSVLVANEADHAAPPFGLTNPLRSWVREGHAPAGGRSRWLAEDPQRLLNWAELEPRALGSVTQPVPTRRRGVFSVGPLRVWVHDPFGLCGCTTAVVGAASVVVYPAPAPSIPYPVWPAVGLEGDTPPHEEGSGPEDGLGDFVGLRPYIPGDRLHLLSWAAEARYGSLMVRQFTSSAEVPVRIILDDRPRVHHRQAFERMLSVATALVCDAADRLMSIDITTLTGLSMAAGVGPEAKVRSLAFLARVNPRSSGTPDAVRANLTQGSLRPGLVLTTATGAATLPAEVGRLATTVVA